MKYQHFTTREAADAAVQAHREAGRCAYALTMRADCHEVRSW